MVTTGGGGWAKTNRDDGEGRGLGMMERAPRDRGIDDHHCSWYPSLCPSGDDRTRPCAPPEPFAPTPRKGGKDPIQDHWISGDEATIRTPV